MTPRLRQPDTHRSGFTIPELVVAVLIAGIILSVTLNGVQSLVRDTRVQVGYNTVASAVLAARTYALNSDQADLGSIDPPPVPDADYSGAAALFTPAGEIRLVENDQRAEDGNSDPLEPTCNGYADIPNVEYIKLPKGVGVVGIAREGIGDPTFHPPPFAIRFDENGQLIAGETGGASESRVVIYDGNYNNIYAKSLSANRPSNYDPDPWDPQSPQWDPNHWDTSVDRYELDFERIEAVIGVIVYSKVDFTDEGGDWPGTAPAGFSSIEDWLAEHGEVMLFSRYSGKVLRER